MTNGIAPFDVTRTSFAAAYSGAAAGMQYDRLQIDSPRTAGFSRQPGTKSHDATATPSTSTQPQQQWGSWADAHTASRIAVRQSLFRGRRWGLPLLLLLLAITYEVAASFIMYVISDFYLAVSSQDLPLFLTVLWKSLIVVVAVASLRAGRDFACEACALQWRCSLVRFLHGYYLKGTVPYQLVHAAGGKAARVDNPDQRLVSPCNGQLQTRFAHVRQDTYWHVQSLGVSSTKRLDEAFTPYLLVRLQPQDLAFDNSFRNMNAALAQ